MILSNEQLTRLNDDGYVIIECPFLGDLTDACLAAVDKVAVDPDELTADAKKNHFTLKPQIPDSYWSCLDHSLPFLRIELHSKIVELGRQLAGDPDIYYRNGGINELAPGRGFLWHRDAELNYIEFMHYFSSATIRDGCLRVVPGSHIGPREPWVERVEQLRGERGYDDPPTMEGPLDVELPDEVSLEVSSEQLIVRSSRIFHSTWKNESDTGRLMHHWLFRESGSDNHRFTFGDYLADDLIDALTGEQRDVMWLDREFHIDPKYHDERERELGKVHWGIV